MPDLCTLACALLPNWGSCAAWLPNQQGGFYVFVSGRKLMHTQYSLRRQSCAQMVRTIVACQIQHDRPTSHLHDLAQCAQPHLASQSQERSLQEAVLSLVVGRLWPHSRHNLTQADVINETLRQLDKAHPDNDLCPLNCAPFLVAWK